MLLHDRDQDAPQPGVEMGTGDPLLDRELAAAVTQVDLLEQALGIARASQPPPAAADRAVPALEEAQEQEFRSDAPSESSHEPAAASEGSPADSAAEPQPGELSPASAEPDIAQPPQKPPESEVATPPPSDLRDDPAHAPAGAGAASASAPGVSPPATPPTKKVQFKIKKVARDGSEQAAPANPAAPRVRKPTTAAATPAKPTVSPAAALGKRLYRVVDVLLEAVNRPFARLPMGARQAMGWASAASIAVSILWLVIASLVFTHRDAFEFLERKRAEVVEFVVEAPPPPAPDPPEGESGIDAP